MTPIRIKMMQVWTHELASYGHKRAIPLHLVKGAERKTVRPNECDFPIMVIADSFYHTTFEEFSKYFEGLDG